eukprot:3928242-Amphidinium_carterae.1
MHFMCGASALHAAHATPHATCPIAAAGGATHCLGRHWLTQSPTARESILERLLQADVDLRHACHAEQPFLLEHLRQWVSVPPQGLIGDLLQMQLLATTHDLIYQGVSIGSLRQLTIQPEAPLSTKNAHTPLSGTGQ